MVRAVALVGFYKGDLVQPGDIVELSDLEFGELRACNKVDLAPPTKAEAKLDAKIESEFKAMSVKESKK